jgi:hypothetical protein
MISYVINVDAKITEELGAEVRLRASPARAHRGRK